MNLASLAATPALPSKRECRTGWALANFSPDEARDLQAALDNPYADSAAIGRAVTELAPVTVGADSIRRHRRGDCTCATNTQETA